LVRFCFVERLAEALAMAEKAYESIEADPVLVDSTSASDIPLAVEVVSQVSCWKCGGGYDGPGAVKLALNDGMFRTAQGWEHALCPRERKG
jgi:hypothetical protein